MRHFIFLGIFSLAVCILSGCSSTQYFAAGKEFDTEAEAMDFLQEVMDEQLATIKRVHYFGGSLMVHVPSNQMLSKPPFSPPPEESTPEEIAFIVKKHKFNYKMITEAIRKSGMFDCVELVLVPENEMIEYGKSHGFRYAFVYNGGRAFCLVDLMLEKDKEIDFTGNLGHVVLSIQDAVVKFEGVQRSSSLADKFSPVDFQPKWDKESQEGSVSVRMNGNPFDCRAWLIENIRKIISGSKQPTGYLPSLDITSENLTGKILTINFRCTGKSGIPSKKKQTGLRNYYKTEAQPEKKDK